jgi:hypothetical protein
MISDLTGAYGYYLAKTTLLILSKEEEFCSCQLDSIMSFEFQMILKWNLEIHERDKEGHQ